MRTLVSRLCSVFILIIAVASAAPRAAGLYEDPFASMTPLDTSRAVVRASQAELDLDGSRASVLSLAARLRKGARARIECAVQFPAIRRPGEIVYGLGDTFVSGTARVAGDTTEVTALYLRGDLRLPTGARGLVPFCYSSFDGSAGLEARAGAGGVSMRALATYTLAGSRTREATFVNDHHMTLSATLALGAARLGSASATLSWTRYRGGADQTTAIVTLRRALSAPVSVAAAFAVQSAGGASELFDWLVGLSVDYRFPPRTAPKTPAAPSPGAPPSSIR